MEATFQLGTGRLAPACRRPVGRYGISVIQPVRTLRATWMISEEREMFTRILAYIAKPLTTSLWLLMRLGSGSFHQRRWQGATSFVYRDLVGLPSSRPL